MYQLLKVEIDTIGFDPMKGELVDIDISIQD